MKVGDCEVYTSPHWNTLSATPVTHQVIAYLSAVEIKMVLTLRLSQVLLVLNRLPPMYERDIVVRLDIPRKCHFQKHDPKILLLNFFLTKEAVWGFWNGGCGGVVEGSLLFISFFLNRPSIWFWWKVLKRKSTRLVISFKVQHLKGQHLGGLLAGYSLLTDLIFF